MNKSVIFRNLSLSPYQETWDLQEKLHQHTISQKIENQKQSLRLKDFPTQNYLIFCQHSPVFTLGKSGDAKHLLLTPEVLRSKNIEYYKINRGGDITFHGPGQIVAYPILDLDNFTTDIGLYLRNLEESVILTLAEYNIQAGRVEGLTGVWVDFENKAKSRKICAIGVKTSRWVTMHGLAFNVNTDLSYYDFIVPCGIQDRAVTSLAKELQKTVDLHEVETKLLRNLSIVFGFEVIYADFPNFTAS